MASEEKPSAIILKARKKLTEVLQRDVELTLNVAKYYSFLTKKEFISLRQTPHKCTEILIDIVLQKGESAHRQFLDFLEKLKHVFPDLQSISEYFEDEDEEEDWEMVMCDGNATEESLPPKVKPEVIWNNSQDSHKSYRLHSEGKSSLLCSYTNLAFDIKEDVTLTYQFDSWPKNLNEGKAEELSIAGPLLIIEADSKEAVEAIHYPHFLNLSDEENSKVRIAYLVKGKVKLEKPNRVGPSHAEVKNPKYFPGGVVLEKPFHQQEIKVNAVALLYQALPASNPTFHLYLLPNDPSLRKTVHEHEQTNHSRRVQKPPLATKPLTFGSYFFVQGSFEVEVFPKELEFRKLDAVMEQQYLEVYVEHMQDKLDLRLVEKSDGVIWETRVRRDELTSSGLPPSVEGPRSVPKTIRDQLADILEDLEKFDLRKFKIKLNEFPIKTDYNNIPNGRLQSADAQELSQLLLQYYKEAYAVEVTAGVLSAINHKSLAEKLLQRTGFEVYKPVSSVIPSSTTLCNKSSIHGNGRVSHFMEEQEKMEVLPGSSTKGTLNKVTVTDDEVLFKRSRLKETLKTEQYDVIGRTKAVIDFLEKVKLQKYKSKKISLEEVMEVTSETLQENTPQSLEDLPWHFLRKVLALNVTARNTSLEWKEWDYGDTKGNENRQGMFFSHWGAGRNSVNPLDILYAVLLCSEGLLQQEIFSKMFLCQFALPLLLPPFESTECTLMLCAMRDIVKQWRPHSLAEGRALREEKLVLIPMPTISFVRLGRPSLSKSKLLNELLSSTQQHYDFCIHQDMKCGDMPREIADGLVEIAWYFPGREKNMDLFPEPFAVTNLRGDIKSHWAQFTFLTHVSSAVLIFTEHISEKEYALLSLLDESLAQCCLILEGDSTKLNETYYFANKFFPQPLIFTAYASLNITESVKTILTICQKIMNSHPKRTAVKDMIAASYNFTVLVDEGSAVSECSHKCKKGS